MKKRVFFLTVLLVSVLALGFAQTAVSGTYRYSANASITFTGSDFTGSWNANTPISGEYFVSGSRLTLYIRGGPRAWNTWTWTIVDANTLKDQDGDSWRKEIPPPQSIATVEYGSNLAEKLEWLSVFAQSNTNYIIEVNADESIRGQQSLSYSGKSNITVTLRGVGANRTLSFQYENYGSGFSVGSGVTLVLDNNITLRTERGRFSSRGVYVGGGGTLIMNDGSTITGVPLVSYAYEWGGGVYVGGAGTFTMNGGTIVICRIAGDGGGVYVGSNGFFTMNGGTISGNTASSSDYIRDVRGGGVYVGGGNFTMNGGEISGNTAQYGGGVYVGVTNINYTTHSGTFTMNGGTISGNTANSGGGVYVGAYQDSVNFYDNDQNGTFTMNGGTISGNTANEGGGGVYVVVYRRYDGTLYRGTFTMSNGEISGNTAQYGGGVYVSGTFTMSGGEISGNTASQNGGGVYVSGTFTKTGGTINGYSAGDTNSNVVKNESGAVQNFRGHAVWAGSTNTLLKIREGTAGPGDNMSYNGSVSPPTASGAWDN